MRGVWAKSSRFPHGRAAPDAEAQPTKAAHSTTPGAAQTNELVSTGLRAAVLDAGLWQAPRRAVVAADSGPASSGGRRSPVIAARGAPGPRVPHSQAAAWSCNRTSTVCVCATVVRLGSRESSARGRGGDGSLWLSPPCNGRAAADGAGPGGRDRGGTGRRVRLPRVFQWQMPLCWPRAVWRLPSLWPRAVVVPEQAASDRRCTSTSISPPPIASWPDIDPARAVVRPRPRPAVVCACAAQGGGCGD